MMSQENHPSRDRNEPGTLVWVGPKSHPEFIDAFRFCVANSAQVAVRNHLQELAMRPAGFVKRIVIARADRRPVPPMLHRQILSHYIDAEFLTLSSSLCDGEKRTGTPWDPIPNLRFSRWQENLPEWLEPCGNKTLTTQTQRSLLFLADRYETAEPHLDYAAALGQHVAWKRTANSLAIRNFDHVIWDDSVAAATDASTWQQRLAVFVNKPVRQSWLVTQPHANEIQVAISAGISHVYTKPTNMRFLYGPH